MNAEAEVDELLASWDDRLRRVDESLLALEGEPTYELLSGVRGSKLALSGVTRDRVEPALAALADLFEHRARLSEVVMRAKEIRKDLSFWNKEQKLHEIKALFYGPSIRMTGSPKPLAQRNLLDSTATDVAVVPDRLLEAMSNVYLVARNVVTAVSSAWAKLEPIVEGAEGELLALKKLANDVGLSAEVAPEIAWLTEELARVRALVSKDPLGASSGVAAELTPRLTELRTRLGDLKLKKTRVTRGLREAEGLERQVVEMHEAAKEALARAGREVSNMSFPALSDDASVLGLAPWRRKIEETARSGRYGPADVGLARWSETAQGFLAQDREVVGKIDAVLHERIELGGRLSARRAQLQAIVSAGAVASPDLALRGKEIEALLRARPTDLTRVVGAMKLFEIEVVALAARAQRG